jgi:hypothetical protein
VQHLVRRIEVGDFWHGDVFITKAICLVVCGSIIRSRRLCISVELFIGAFVGASVGTFVGVFISTFVGKVLLEQCDSEPCAYPN